MRSYKYKLPYPLSVLMPLACRTIPCRNPLHHFLRISIFHYNPNRYSQDIHLFDNKKKQIMDAQNIRLVKEYKKLYLEWERGQGQAQFFVGTSSFTKVEAAREEALGEFENENQTGLKKAGFSSRENIKAYVDQERIRYSELEAEKFERGNGTSIASSSAGPLLSRVLSMGLKDQ